MNEKNVPLYDFTNIEKWMHDYNQWSMVRYEMKELNTTSKLSINL